MGEYDPSGTGPGYIGAYHAGSGDITAGSIIANQVNCAPPPAVAGRANNRTQRSFPRADIGVITVLHQEMRAMVQVLQRSRSYRTRQLYGGAQAHEADLPVAGTVLRTVVLQALDRGPRSAVVAYHRVRQHYAPPIVLLVGVAGATGADLTIGDVVISDEVIYYDARRETAEGVRRRGQSLPIAPVLRHRLNEFFRVHGDTIQNRNGSSFRVRQGPVGSGDAVVTDRDSDIRRWLHQTHEKTLAVETEAGGIAQAFYEEVEHDSTLRGWLTIRGISDQADRAKGHAYHDLAATRAAEVFERLVPFLLLTGAGT